MEYLRDDGRQADRDKTKNASWLYQNARRKDRGLAVSVLETSSDTETRINGNDARVLDTKD